MKRIHTFFFMLLALTTTIGCRSTDHSYDIAVNYALGRIGYSLYGISACYEYRYDDLINQYDIKIIPYYGMGNTYAFYKKNAMNSVSNIDAIMVYNNNYPDFFYVFVYDTFLELHLISDREDLFKEIPGLYHRSCELL